MEPKQGFTTAPGALANSSAKAVLAHRVKGRMPGINPLAPTKFKEK